MNRTITPIALFAITPLLTGCLINSRSTEVVQAKDTRTAVDFDSDTGMQYFVKKVNTDYASAKNLGTDHFAVPFIISATNQKVLAENAFFNSQVAKADLNLDGKLSDGEVSAYTGKTILSQRTLIGTWHATQENNGTTYTVHLSFDAAEHYVITQEGDGNTDQWYGSYQFDPDSRNVSLLERPDTNIQLLEANKLSFTYKGHTTNMTKLPNT